MALFSFIKSNLSILDVVLEYVRLKQVGNYWKGTCPFHYEKDASFTVSPDKGIFYCFGCNTGGDVITFIAKIENISPLEATRHLIDRYKLNVPEDLSKEFSCVSGEVATEKSRHVFVCEVITDWARKQLLLEKKALQYLNARSIDEKSRTYFRLGYFKGGMRVVNSFIEDARRKNILLQDLLEIGFLIQSGNTIYSPFEDRIMFPIRDVLGRCCGFGGRIFKSSDHRAKYYNSRESNYFQKSQMLFGLDLAKKEMRTKEYAFLVEGYTDCIAMVRHGYKNTVATLGTACSLDHLKILSRYIKTLYVLYDGDTAGQKAALRLTELCWNANLDFKIVVLPSKEDPASYLEKRGELDILIGQAKDIFSFFVDSLGHSFITKSLPEKLELSKKIVRIISKIDDPFKRTLLLQRATSVLQVSLASLEGLMMKGIDQAENVRKGETSRGFVEKLEGEGKIPENGKDLGEICHLEKKILFAIISKLDGDVDYIVEKDLNSHFSKQMRFFFDRIKAVLGLPRGSRFTAFFEGLDTKTQAWIGFHSLSFNEEVDPGFFRQLILQFRMQRWKAFVRGVKEDLLKAKQAKNDVKLKELLEKFMHLKEEMKNKGIL